MLPVLHACYWQLSLYLIFWITFCLNTVCDYSRVAQRSYLYPSPPLSQSLLYLSPPFIPVPPLSQSLLHRSPSYNPVPPLSQSLLYPSPPFIPVPPTSQSLLYPSPSYIPVPPISQSLLYPSPSYNAVPPISQSLLHPSPSYIPIPPIPVPPLSQPLLHRSPFPCPSYRPSFLLYRSNAKQQVATEQVTNRNRTTYKATLTFSPRSAPSVTAGKRTEFYTCRRKYILLHWHQHSSCLADGPIDVMRDGLSVRAQYVV